MKINKKLPLILCSTMLLQACAPNLPFAFNPAKIPQNKSNIALPHEFPHISEMKNISKKVPSEAEKIWEEFFADKQLKALIAVALTNNQELNILKQDINIAKNEIMFRRGEYLPKVGAGIGYELDRVGEFTSQGASDEATGVGKILHNRRAGFFASWEVDIWKRLRNATKSAYLQYLASIEGRKFATTRLVAEIANSYYELIALDNQLEIVKSYIETLQQAQEMIQLQQIAGRSTSLPVKRFEAEVLKNKSRQYEIEQRIIISENQINALLGRFPQPIERESAKFMQITPKNMQTGLPAKLLENRPDVKQAALELKANKLDVKAAKARFYPALSIDANVGYEAFNSAHFFNTPQSLAYNLAANLTAPLLNRLAIKADYFSANNKQIQAIYNYELKTIKAYIEVVNQLATINNVEKIYNLRSQQVKALEDSVEISNMLFRAARVDYVESLLTQRDFLEAKIELVEVKKQQLTSYIELYKALGGGWRIN